ncbi:MAG: hypothetical protein HOQ01_04980 [Lysobacter sp.]|nr:hypothetical protein [Lysobacter sp.]
MEQRILDPRDEEAGIDTESFDRSEVVIDRCNKLARDAAKPYASNPLNLEELRRTAERMRDDRSPLFRVLQAPPAKVEAALRREPGTQLTVSVAIRDNAARIFGDEACGVMIDEFLVPMLFPAQELIPSSELEALRKQHGVNYGHVDSWLFLLLVREAGKLQAETKLQQVADCLERSCPQIAVADALKGSREAIVQQLRAGRATPMETVSRNGRAYDVWRTMAGANLEVAIVAAFDGDAVSNATVGIVWD